MNRKTLICTLIILSLVMLAACTDTKSPNPLLKLRDEQVNMMDVGQGQVYTTLKGTRYLAPQSVVYKTDRVTGPIPTNDWWSSAAWMPYSGAIYPHPLVVRANNEGLNVAYPGTRTTGGSFHALYKHSERDLTIGGTDYIADSALVDGFGDWHVDLLLPTKEGDKSIRATLTHGSPFIYLSYDHMNPLITLNGDSQFIQTNHEEIAVFRVNDHNYALFAPSGTAWESGGANTLTVALTPDQQYISLALIPDTGSDTIELFKQYAYSFITGTGVEWEFDEDTSKVTTSYTIETESREGSQTGTIMALYPHQWKNTDSEFLPFIYESPRGIMKTIEGRSFTTEMTYHGILPYLPNVGVDEERLNEFLSLETISIMPSPEEEGTYWYGKNYNRLANLLPIAHMLGNEQQENAIKERIRQDMEQTFTNTNENRMAYYDRTWGTLNIYPTQFGADMVLNDHHFHYGYWVYAAAMVAYEDSEWAQPEQMGGMIELMIRDYANWDREESDNSLFPFLRTFDPYAGHSWASGNATDVGSYSPGNNQESSSEALMSSAALILWGDATGNKEIRDTGIYLYTTEVEAVKNYWFDTENENFPEDYEQDYAPIVLSAGGEFRTWWTANPEELYGINILPVSGASLYLGHDPEYAQRYYQDMTLLNGGPPQEWRDILWMYKALFDSDGAMEDFNSSPPIPEYGESRTHTYQWISSLKELGRVDTSIVANTPLFAVFNKEGKRTAVAYNGSEDSITVSFRNVEDGDIVHEMKIPAKQMKTESIQ